MNRHLFQFAIGVVFLLPAAGLAQTPPKDPAKEAAAAQARLDAQKQKTLKRIQDSFRKSESSGVKVRVKDIAQFRGAWSNQISGIGLVTGLDATGDTRKFTPTMQAFTNLLRKNGLDAATGGADSRNVAMVMVTATLPPYAAPGQTIDVTVSTVGDAKSLRGGTLYFTALKYNGGDRVYATAEGPISVGGFAVAAGGNTQTKGFVTVGRIPSGAIVQEGVQTAVVFNGKMYIDLDLQDATTAHGLEQRINQVLPEFQAVALNGRTVEISLPEGMRSTTAQARLEDLVVEAENEAKVVVNERTGMVVIGGNVRIGPCVFAKGNISVRIVEDISVSQPNPLSNGTTEKISNKSLDVLEDEAQIALLEPKTTVADLAFVLRQMKLKASDIIDILQTLRSQGALKARLVLE